MRPITFFALSLSCAGAAVAAPVTVPVDESRSSLAVELSTSVGGFPVSDADSAPIGGSIDATVTLAGDLPTEILLEDFTFELTEPLVLNLGVIFVGSVTFTLPAGTQAVYVSGPGAASPVGTDGSFTIPGVVAGFAGTATAAGTLGGTPVNQSVDLAGFDPSAGEVSGTVTVGPGGVLTLTMSIDASATADVEVTDGVTLPVTVNADATVVGSVTLANPCPSDITNDGVLNNSDINAFVNAFIAMDPAADFNADGSFNNTDINLFVNGFLDGCPG